MGIKIPKDGTDLTIQMISEQCGFERSSNFGKVFRKYMGISAGGFMIPPAGTIVTA